jgi:hypothetical protein
MLTTLGVAPIARGVWTPMSSRRKMSKEYCNNKMTTESKEELRSKLKDALEEAAGLHDKVDEQSIVIGLLASRVRELITPPRTS